MNIYNNNTTKHPYLRSYEPIHSNKLPGWRCVKNLRETVARYARSRLENVRTRRGHGNSYSIPLVTDGKWMSQRGARYAITKLAGDFSSNGSRASYNLVKLSNVSKLRRMILAIGRGYRVSVSLGIRINFAVRERPRPRYRATRTNKVVPRYTRGKLVRVRRFTGLPTRTSVVNAKTYHDRPVKWPI